MNATETIKEALREYVGDGDGADEKILAAHDREVARAGYQAAREDVIGGAFVAGPTYEALKNSHSGRWIAAETLEAEVRSDKYDRPCEDRLLEAAERYRREG